MSSPRAFGVTLFVGLLLVVAASRGASLEEPKDGDPRTKNARERLRLAKDVYEGSFEHHRQDASSSPSGVEHYYRWSVRWMQAERDLGRTQIAREAAFEDHLKRMKFWKERRALEREEGYVTAAEAAAAEFFFLEAEEWLIAARTTEK
jgi:hypothetical protein